MGGSTLLGIRTSLLEVNPMHLDRYAELQLYGFREELETCKIWVYDDVLTDSQASSFKHILLQALQGDTRINYEGRTFTIGNESVSLIGTQARHNYIKIWSIVDYKDYYYQTKDTVYDWCHGVLNKDLHPALRYLVDAIEHQADVFKGKQVIPLRFFVNVFPEGQAMELHVDGNRYEIPIDMEYGDLWSATYYLQVPSQGGGQLWFPKTDFEYMPKVNSMAIFNGNKFTHGVKSGPPSSDNRISITVRYAVVDDLMLPGHPDKWLYKPDLSKLTK